MTAHSISTMSMCYLAALFTIYVHEVRIQLTSWKPQGQLVKMHLPSCDETRSVPNDDTTQVKRAPAVLRLLQVNQIILNYAGCIHSLKFNDTFW